MDSSLTTNGLDAGAAARAAAPAPARLAEREAVWESLVSHGLVWAPRAHGPKGPGAEGLTLSSPQEWVCEQWKDAALHVLQVEEALAKLGWTLSAPSARCVQFFRCRPVWVSMTALAPRPAGAWRGRQAFEDSFLKPLWKRCGSPAGGRGWRRWLDALRQAASRVAGAAPRDELAALRKMVEPLRTRGGWSPWICHARGLEPARLQSILAREEVQRLNARLVYEWRGRQPGSEEIQPCPGTAWIRFHESETGAAADYLKQRAQGGNALPLWSRTGDPMKACPQRTEADLVIAAGRGSVPAGTEALAAFAQVIRRMAPAALVEFVPQTGGAGWDEFAAVLHRFFRMAWVMETGGGRRLCLLARA